MSEDLRRDAKDVGVGGWRLKEKSIMEQFKKAIGFRKRKKDRERKTFEILKMKRIVWKQKNKSGKGGL